MQAAGHRAARCGAGRLARTPRRSRSMPPFGGVWKGMARARRRLVGADAGRRRDARAASARPPRDVPAGFRRSIPSSASCSQTRREMSRGQGAHRLGLRRDARPGQPAAGRHADPLCRAGCPARHLQPSPRLPARLQHRREVLSRWPISRPTRRRSSSSTRCSRSWPCSASSMASPRPIRGTWSSGKPSSAISSTAPSRSSTSSSRPAKPSGSKYCGLVMLLPHGYEGPGPRALQRLRRAVPVSSAPRTTCRSACPRCPSQYFHLLRRQMLRQLPQAADLLSRPRACCAPRPPTSLLAEFTDRTFQLVLDDPASSAARAGAPGAAVHRQGLLHARCRPAEEQHPRRGDRPRRAALSVPAEGDAAASSRKYNNAQEIGWVQEEPRNRGGWTFMEQRLRPILPDVAVLNYYRPAGGCLPGRRKLP